MTTYKHPYARNPQLVNLHDYQRQMANFAIEHPKCGLFLPMGSGKAIDDDALIPTANDFVRVGDIRKGDWLIGRDGLPTRVLEVWHHKHKDALEFTLEDNRVLVCCTEHLISHMRQGRLITEDAETIRKRMNSGETIMLPEAATTKWPHQDIPVNPYIFGVFFACGSLSSGAPALKCDRALVERFCEILDIPISKISKAKNLVGTWHIGAHLATRQFKRACRETGTFGMSKRVRKLPIQYVVNDIATRTELMRGIIDGLSGTIVQAPNGISLRTPSKRFANDLATIARSLGMSATIHVRHQDTANSKIYITIPTMASLGERRTVRCVAVHKAAPRNMTCFTVDAPDHLFLANDFIVTHNTLTTLEVIWELAPRCKILIIGPRPVVRSTWVDEVKKWRFPLRIRSLIEDDRGRALGPKKRHQLYHDVCASNEAAIWLINREMVTDLVENLPKIKDSRGRDIPKWPFKMVVIDEAQAFKTYNSKRFRALASVMNQTSRVIELTGTPTPNGLMDLWALIYLLDQGKRLGPNITTYRTSYFYSTMTTANGAPIGWVPLKWAQPAIHEKVSDIVVSLPDIRKNMPDLVFSDHTIQLNTNERALYAELVREQVLEFDDGNEVIAANAAVLQAKLSQLASGAIYVNGTSEYKELHRRKVDEVLRIVDQAGGPVLVAYHFRSDKEMLVKYMREALDKKRKSGQAPLAYNDPSSHVQVFDGSPDMVRRWNDKKIDVMLIQPASAGHGLNLQHGGSTLVWYTLPWNLEHYLQTNARLYRQGQTETVFIHRLMTENTVDGKIERALNKKDMSERALLDAVATTIQDIT